MKSQWLIIADGEPTEKAQTKQLATDKSIIVLDGALTTALEYGIIPDIVMGDFDSLTSEYINQVKEKYPIEFIHKSCQDTTDLEKALTYLSETAATDVTLCHATGWRLDHTLYNLRLLKRFHKQFEALNLITAREKISFLCDESIELTAKKPQRLALMAFPQAIVTSQGLEFDMTDYPLKFGYQESTSNRITSHHAKIQVKGEALLLWELITLPKVNPRAM